MRLVLTACLFLAACDAQQVRRAPGMSLADLGKSILPAGRQLAHPVVTGDFGPGKGNVVVLHQAASGSDRNFGGVVLTGGPAVYRSCTLPPLNLLPGQFEIEILAVFFANANRDPAAELFVLYSYHRNGSQEDDGFAVAAYEWKGGTFAALPLAAKLAGLSTAAAVKARLKQLGY